MVDWAVVLVKWLWEEADDQEVLSLYPGTVHQMDHIYLLLEKTENKLKRGWPVKKDGGCDSNCNYLVSKVTTVPIVPKPIPIYDKCKLYHLEGDFSRIRNGHKTISLSSCYQGFGVD